MQSESKKDLLVAAPDILSNNDLCYLIAHGEAPDKATEVLLSRSTVRNDDLCCIIEHTTKPTHKEHAAAMLIARDMNHYDLRCLIRHTDRREEAGKRLLSKGSLSDDDLLLLIRNTEHKNTAAKLLLSRPPNRENLYLILKQTNYKEEAWKMLLSMNPTNSELFFIIKDTDYKQPALNVLLSRPDNYCQLAYLITRTRFKTEVHKALADNLSADLSRLIPESAMIKKIAEIVLDNPKKLNVYQSYDDSRSLADWVLELDPYLKEVAHRALKHHPDLKPGSRLFATVAACLSLPNYAYLFYRPKKEVMRALKNLEL